MSELIPFFLRISRYFCGVMYLIITLPAALSNWEKQVLSLNPFAVYISLVRVGFMSSYRADSAGNQPYNAGLCYQFMTNPGPGHYITPGTTVPTTLIDPGSKFSSIVVQPGSKISNIPLQAYCHAIVTNNDLWIAAVGWGVAFSPSASSSSGAPSTSTAAASQPARRGAAGGSNGGKGPAPRCSATVSPRRWRTAPGLARLARPLLLITARSAPHRPLVP